MDAFKIFLQGFVGDVSCFVYVNNIECCNFQIKNVTILDFDDEIIFAGDTGEIGIPVDAEVTYCNDEDNITYNFVKDGIKKSLTFLE